MYRTLGSSRLPVICVESRSRRSLALPRAAGLAAGLLAAAGAVRAGVPVAPVDCGVDAGVVSRGVTGVADGAEVFTPGSRSAGDFGSWAMAAAASNSRA